MRNGLTDADLNARAARARRFMDREPVGSETGMLAAELLATVTELQWWREQYGTAPVPLMPVAADGR